MKISINNVRKSNESLSTHWVSFILRIYMNTCINKQIKYSFLLSILFFKWIIHDAVMWKNTYYIHFKCFLGFLLPKARYVWSKLTFDTSIHQIYLLRRYHRDDFVASLKFLYKNIQMLLIFPIKLKVKVNIKEFVPRTFIQKQVWALKYIVILFSFLSDKCLDNYLRWDVSDECIFSV